VRDTPGVVAAAPLVYSQVMLTTGQNVSGVVVRGVPPGDDAAIVDLKGHLTSGSIDRLGAEFEVPSGSDTGSEEKKGAKPSKAEPPKTVSLTGVIIGQELAKQLGVDIGDPVSVVSPMGTASPVGMIPKVKRFAVAGERSTPGCSITIRRSST